MRVTAKYKRALDHVVTLIETLRAGRPLMLRATTVYNNVIGDHNDPGWDSRQPSTRRCWPTRH
jgi:hypothetical protein